KIVTELNDNTTYSYTATTSDSSHRFELIFSLQKLRWLGNYSTNWADITNWSNNALPLGSDDVILNSWTKNQPHVTMPITSPATCMNLIINPATNVTIEPGKALTVNGTLTNNAGNLGLIIKSDTSGTGSLLHTTANVVGTIERFINQPYADEFHMLATPVAAQPISPNFNETDGFYVWNEPNYSWVEYADSANFVLINGGTNFVPGKGYAVSYPSSQTKVFTGILNQGDITIPISYTIGMDAGWNFVGNPYPSPISWNANSGWNRNILENANVNEKAIWIWNAAVGNYGAYISNASIGTNSVSSNIPLAQGFWVKSASAGMLSMNDDVRIHANPAFLKQSTTNADMLRLKVKSITNNYSDEIIISFGNDNNLGGAEKIYSLDATAPGLFSSKLNKKWSINYLSSVAENALIPVGFKAGVDGNYTISALGIQSFGTVMLEDIKNNIQHNLSQDYSFDAQTTDNQNRFLLHFNPNNINEKNVENTPSIYYFNQTIAVYNPWAGKTMIAIYDINGKLIQSFTAKEGNGNYSFTSAQGVYIVKIVNDKHVFVKKEVVY
ncbi:MAG: T9SS type A sorting domain-containing protein, partial [Bacteroidales bacterium]